jgi:hypothetical protein
MSAGKCWWEFRKRVHPAEKEEKQNFDILWVETVATQNIFLEEALLFIKYKIDNRPP